MNNFARTLVAGALLGPGYSCLKLFFDLPEPFPLQGRLVSLTDRDLFVIAFSTVVYSVGGILLAALYFLGRRIIGQKP